MTSSMNCQTATLFCLVRHGETAWNREKRVQGQIDIDLNPRGQAQARALRAGLAGQAFDAVYSSDLRRAWSTALIAMDGTGLSVTADPALRERHFGMLQGLTAEEAAHRLPEVHRRHKARVADFDLGDGESLARFGARVVAALELLAVRHRGQKVLVFTHGGVLDVAYRAATGRPIEAPRDFPLSNAALNWIEHHDGAWRLLTWADCDHLSQTLDEVTG